MHGVIETCHLSQPRLIDVCSSVRFTETDYLETFADNPGDIYDASNIDKAMMNCFMQTRKFVMAQYDLTENEATVSCSLAEK
jgi:hypothetical protein